MEGEQTTEGDTEGNVEEREEQGVEDSNEVEGGGVQGSRGEDVRTGEAVQAEGQEEGGIRVEETVQEGIRVTTSERSDGAGNGSHSPPRSPDLIEEPMDRSTLSQPTNRSAISQLLPDTAHKDLSKTNARLVVHDREKKYTWSLTSINANTRTLLITDSQFRNLKDVPQSWEVHVFPGASLTHAASILKSLPAKRNVERIVLHVGINNKGWAEENNRHDLNKLLLSAKRTGVETHFCGVSIPRGLSAKEKASLTQLNEHAAAKFAQKNFIAPLETNQVSVDPRDIFGIHYDQNTLSKVIEKINAHFLSKTHRDLIIPISL